MKIPRHQIILKSHLIISVVIVVPTALIYGINPKLKLEIFPHTTDEHNFLKAIMGVYLGFAVLWSFGLFKKNYLKAALLSNVIFMLGLAFGRLLSWFIDGAPSALYQYGVIGELILGCYGIWLLNSKYSKNL